MEPVDRLGSVATALPAAKPDSIHLVVRDHLMLDFGAIDAELFLVDYRQTVLCRTIDDGRAGVRVDAGPAGQAFRHDDLVVATSDRGVRCHAPVSVRGNCVGVLAATWPSRPDLAVQQDFRTLAGLVGHALVVAETATDHYRSLRRQRRMTLAAEMQWNLLPGRGLGSDQFQLAGQLEPAYEIRGDVFDWSVDQQRLTIAVCNGMGDGLSAALLTSLAINALRNGRLAGLPLDEQAALANEMIWSQFTGRSHVATLLLGVELATGTVRVVDAGSPAVFLVRGGEHERICFDANLPLGMFDGTAYREHVFELDRGDRLLLLSDGVVEAALDGRRYGATRLDRVIRTGRLLPPAAAVRLLLNDLMTFHHSQDLADDAVAVCLNWTGKSAEKTAGG